MGRARRENSWCAFAGLVVLLVVVSSVIGVTSSAQYYTTGADPLHLRWYRLSGDLWRIDADSLARPWGEAANGVLTDVAPLLRQDFTTTACRSVDVVVHSRTGYSNGLVSWAPRRLEAYAYDNGQEDCVPWVRHLLTHEYRHVLQMQTVDNRFTRFLKVIFGEQAIGLVVGAFVPRWALEGDAVWAETRYTDGGRGRSALFLQQMRAQVLAGNAPTYGQAYFSSYRYRFPDYYHMGYLTVSAVNGRYGGDVVPRALADAGRRPFTFVPFVRSVRQSTGSRLIGNYRQAIGDYGAMWEREQAGRQPSAVRAIGGRTSDYEELVSARPLGEGYVVYVSSPSVVSRFEYISKEGERRALFTPSYRTETIFSLRSNKMAWAEYRQHGRWDNASDLCIMTADITDDARVSHKRRLTAHGYYHSPALDSLARRVACVAVDNSQQHSVAVIDLETGEEERLLAVAVGEQIAEVAWIDEESLALVLVTERGKAIARLSLTDGSLTTLLAPRLQNIRNISASPSRLLFSMDADGYADLYSLRLADRALHIVGRSAQGLDYPIDNGGKIVASNYDEHGYALVEVARDDTTLVETATIGTASQPTATPAPSSATWQHVGPMAIHLLPNIHSWGPVVVDADEATVRPGVSLSSQNRHGTVSWQAGVNFGSEYEDERVFVTTTWDFLLPKLTLGAHWGHIDYSYDYTTQSATTQRNTYLLTEVQTDDKSHVARLESSLSIPLTHNTGRWLRGVTPTLSLDWEKYTGLTYNITQVLVTQTPRGLTTQDYSRESYTADDSKYVCLTPSLYLYSLWRTATRDINYRLGLQATALLDFAQHGTTSYGSMRSLFLTAYLPGIGRHHAVTLTANMQSKTEGDSYTSSAGTKTSYILSDRVSAPLGLARITNKKAKLFRLTYALPLVNPDLMAGPVVYLKRVNLRLIGDYGIAHCWDGQQVSQITKRWTASGELTLDTRWFLLPYPVKLGVRATYLPDSQSLTAESLFSVTFN